MAPRNPCAPPRPADDEDDEPLHGKTGANGKLPASSIFDLAGRQANARRPIGWPGTKDSSAGEAISPANGSQKPDDGAATPAAKAGSDFRVGLFSDGALRLEWRGQIIDLEREQTEQLVRFLDRLAPEVAA